MGILAAMPYLIMGFVVAFSGHLADYLRRRFSTTVVRKVFTSGCYVAQMALLLTTAHMTSQSAGAALACLTAAVAVGGFAAYSVNFQDLGPQYAALTVGVSNTIATLPGLISPSITGYIVQNKVVYSRKIVDCTALSPLYWFHFLCSWHPSG